MPDGEQRYPITIGNTGIDFSSDPADQQFLDSLNYLDTCPIWESPDAEGIDITFSRHLNMRIWLRTMIRSPKQIAAIVSWIAGLLLVILLGSTISYVIVSIFTAVWIVATLLGSFVIFGAGIRQNTGDRIISIHPDQLHITTEHQDDSFDWSQFSAVDLSSSFFFLNGRNGHDIWLHLIPHNRNNFVNSYPSYARWIHSRYPEALSINLGWDHSREDILAGLQRCGVGLS